LRESGLQADKALLIGNFEPPNSYPAGSLIMTQNKQIFSHPETVVGHTFTVVATYLHSVSDGGQFADLAVGQRLVAVNPAANSL
jgi:hypothetical protein